MRTQVTFRSHKFPPYAGEEEQINPGLWGKRLAEYVSYNLKGYDGSEILAPIKAAMSCAGPSFIQRESRRYER